MAALRERDVQLARQQQFRHIAAAVAGRPDADQIDRAVTDIVITVPGEILGGKFPIARNASLSECRTESRCRRRCRPRRRGSGRGSARNRRDIQGRAALRGPGGPYRALAEAQLRHLDSPQRDLSSVP